ncbi:hypothetical protein ACFE04_026230 [Oxalis oulophora]
MTVARVASTQTKKLMKFGLSLFGLGFNASKCKTAAKMTVARIKLLRNKREVVVRQMRRDIALLLHSGQASTARIRVEHVIREQNIMAANEIIELFCELLVARLSIIAKQRECPADLKEGIASLIFATPRCSEIPELISIRNVFQKKYGKDFVSAATDLRPSCGVNRLLIDKLSVKAPTGEVKLKVMKEIAKEHQVEWDVTETEQELLKPPEELIEGPNAFVSASSFPVKPLQTHAVEPNKPTNRPTMESDGGAMHFEDTASAAKAAAKLANQAIAAAQAAAYLAERDNNNNSSHMFQSRKNTQVHRRHSYNNPPAAHSDGNFHRRHSYNNTTPPATGYSYNDELDRSNFDEEEEEEDEAPIQTLRGGKLHRRNSYNGGGPASRSEVKFDESDYDDGEDTEEEKTTPGWDYYQTPPPTRPPPTLPMPDAKQDPAAPPVTHPKLPDYEELTARFDALKYRKS